MLLRYISLSVQLELPSNITLSVRLAAWLDIPLSAPIPLIATSTRPLVEPIPETSEERSKVANGFRVLPVEHLKSISAYEEISSLLSWLLCWLLCWLLQSWLLWLQSCLQYGIEVGLKLLDATSEDIFEAFSPLKSRYS